MSPKNITKTAIMIAAVVSSCMIVTIMIAAVVSSCMIVTIVIVIVVTVVGV